MSQESLTDFVNVIIKTIHGQILPFNILSQLMYDHQVEHCKEHGFLILSFNRKNS